LFDDSFSFAWISETFDVGRIDGRILSPLLYAPAKIRIMAGWIVTNLGREGWYCCVVFQRAPGFLGFNTA
jgi:hypothetical protein